MTTTARLCFFACLLAVVLADTEIKVNYGKFPLFRCERSAFVASGFLRGKNACECDMANAKVCAEDGHTYLNTCWAECFSSVACEGTCPCKDKLQIAISF